jgi:hypothetical protein
MLTAMTAHDSSLDAAEVARARALLAPAPAPAPTHQRLWPVVAAAGALAIASLGFATAMVLAPAVVKQHTARSAPP